MSKIKPRLARGMRDFLPQTILKRREILDKFVEIFERYGFLPLETPALEHIEILTGKYGEDERLIYRLEKRSEKESAEDLGLRYDLTVPLARVIAMNQDLVFPFKRYQIQPVWRADRPQKGRFREFYQCDIDIIGTDSIIADCEIIAVLNEALESIGFSKFTIQINHRKILKAIADFAGVGEEKYTSMCTAIDKFDKKGITGVEEELHKRLFVVEQTRKIIDIISIQGSFEEKYKILLESFQNSTEGIAGLNDLKTMFENLEYMNVPMERLQFSLVLARGLDYYTGPIFETVVEEPKIGALTGGGRYDDLIGVFSGQKIPATGSSLGLERILTVFDELGIESSALQTVDVIVINSTEELKKNSIEILAQLRKEKIKSEVYYNSKKDLRTQLAYASKKNIPLALILFPDEWKEGKVVIKDLVNRDQIIIPKEVYITAIKKLLNNKF
jgi:histidyl-tRNA synthetase